MTDTTEQIEIAMAKRVIADLLAHDNLWLDVNDGEEDVLYRREKDIRHGSRDADAIFRAMRSTDADRLLIWHASSEPGGDAGRIGDPFAWIYFVWGNGVDVISDYTTNMEGYVKGAEELASKFEENALSLDLAALFGPSWESFEPHAVWKADSGGDWNFTVFYKRRPALTVLIRIPGDLDKGDADKVAQAFLNTHVDL